jgi:hypothetical protein
MPNESKAPDVTINVPNQDLPAPVVNMASPDLAGISGLVTNAFAELRRIMESRNEPDIIVQPSTTDLSSLSNAIAKLTEVVRTRPDIAPELIASLEKIMPVVTVNVPPVPVNVSLSNTTSVVERDMQGRATRIRNVAEM